MKLSDVVIGKRYKLIDYNSADAGHRKSCLTLGLLKGTIFKVIRVGPFDDTVEINFRGYNLMIRKSDFSSLEIKLLEE
jgi:ferrous iron transport protein A